MKKVLRIVTALLALVVVAAAGGILYFFVHFPAVGAAPQLTVESSPQRIARGRYLAEHVTSCVDCHSARDWSHFAGPTVRGTEFQGGGVMGHAMGLPGTLVPPNLTPAALSDWSDGELLRAMTSGVDKDGRPLFPLMPYPGFAHLSQEDAESIIAYLRTLPAGGDTTRHLHVLDFPLNLLVRTMPQTAHLRTTTPTPADGTSYGEYLVHIAGCTDCHTPAEKGAPLPGMYLAGGQEFHIPGSGVAVVTANITPDQETGIGSWSREDFVGRFKGFAGKTAEVASGQPNTIMPWTVYAGMTGEDLGAIYDYLRTVPAVHHHVDRWPREQKLAQAH